METKEIRPFIALCNNFIDAKYIMMGNNIVKLIECINEDDSLREVVKKCMVNFDFTTELGLALSATKAIPKDFIMPKENEKVVALCYSVLQQIALNQIDYEAFISKHFIYDGTISDVYKNFGHYFILPFKNAVLYLENAKNIECGLEKNTSEDSNSSEQSDELKEIALDMERVVESDYKIKEEKENLIKYYIRAFKEAIRINNRILICTMMKILMEEIEKIKSLRGVYERLVDAYDAI